MCNGNRFFPLVAVLSVVAATVVACVAAFANLTSNAAESWTPMSSGESWSCTYTRLGTTYTVNASPMIGDKNCLILVPIGIQASNGGRWEYVYPNGAGSGSTNAIYVNGVSGPTGMSNVQLYKSERAIKSTGTWGNFHLEQTMTVTTDGEIVHEMTFTYNGAGTFTGRLAPSIDTQLNGNDQIPISANGADGGYIVGNDYTLAFDKINGVETLYVGHWNTSKSGGEWYSCTGQPNDKLLVSGVDSATFYETQQLSLTSGQSYTFSFKENTFKNDECRVLLDGNGGTFDGDPTSSSWVKKGDYVTIDKTPTYAKHQLVGWSESRDGSSGLFNPATTPVTKNLTLYAQWELIKHSVTFDPNGGTLTGEATQSVEDGDKATKPSDPTRTGYKFAGWYTSASGGDAFDFDAAVTGDKTAYAHWTPITYSITFDGNGSDGGSMSTQSMTYDVEKALTTNAYVKSGYSFAGWNTSADGSGTSYADGQSVVNLTATDGDTIELFAQWTADPQSVRYDNNAEDATGTTDDTVGATDSDVAIAECGFERVGYEFGGWNTSADGSGTAYVAGDEVTLLSGGIDLFAQWIPNTYAVRFHGNHPDATSEMSDQQMTYDVAANLTANAFERVGYSFVGWSYTADPSYDDGSDVNDDENADDGENVNDAEDVDGVGNDTDESDDTSDAQDDMASDDETDDADGKTTDVMSVDALASDDGTDDITDDAGAASDNENASNGENASSDDAANDVNENVNDTDTTTDDENADASDVAFADCEEVVNLTAENGGVVDLYAVWSPNEARIHYVANLDGVISPDEAANRSSANGENGTTNADGDVSSDDIDATDADASSDDDADAGMTDDTVGKTDETVKLAENGFHKENYHFVEWNSSADGSGASYHPGDDWTLAAGTVNLYAIWSNDPAVIVYDKNSDTATGEMPNTDGYIDMESTVSDNGFENSGYKFIGWNTEADGSGTAYDEGDSIVLTEPSITLYAQWEEIPVIVQMGAVNGAIGTFAAATATLAACGVAAYLVSKRR